MDTHIILDKHDSLLYIRDGQIIHIHHSKYAPNFKVKEKISLGIKCWT